MEEKKKEEKKKYGEIKVKISVDSSELDGAIEKAKEICAELEKAGKISEELFHGE